MPTLTPAYGREYHTAKDAKHDYYNGKDFILNDVTSPYDGKFCSCRDFEDEVVTLRFHRLRRVTTAKFTVSIDSRYTGE